MKSQGNGLLQIFASFSSRVTGHWRAIIARFPCLVYLTSYSNTKSVFVMSKPVSVLTWFWNCPFVERNCLETETGFLIYFTETETSFRNYWNHLQRQFRRFRLFEYRCSQKKNGGKWMTHAAETQSAFVMSKPVSVLTWFWKLSICWVKLFRNWNRFSHLFCWNRNQFFKLSKPPPGVVSSVSSVRI